MDLDPGPEAREIAATVAAELADAGGPSALAAAGDAAAARALLARLRRALGPLDAGDAVAGRLALAAASPALLLALDATRHLATLLAVGQGAPLPPAEAEALARGARVGAVARADDAGGGPARLVRDGEGFRLTARKAFVTNAPIADWIGVLVDSGAGTALCLVAPSDPGLRVGRPLALMGLDGLAVAAVEADRAPVAAHRVLLPRPGAAPDALGALYDREANLSLALGAAGLMRGVLGAARRHALAHRRDDRPVYGRQEVSFQLAEVRARADAAELLARRAAWMVATGAPEADTLVACAKVFCCENAERAASACLQVMAGEGYRRGSPAERAYRDAKGLALAGTTLERARMAIADALLARGA